MVDAAVLDRLTDVALRDTEDPAALTLLLRRYVETGRADLREAAGVALARAMHKAGTAADRDERSAWLGLFLEALTLSDDERLRAASAALAEELSCEWPCAGVVGSLLRVVDVVLKKAAGFGLQASGFGLQASGRASIAAAIDEMERVVGLAYAPGAGIAHAIGQVPDRKGTLGDHASAAATLLTAHGVTGRLPYGMLAEELMQFARRQWWDEGSGTFSGSSIAAQCEAARVFCRLARMQSDEDYRRAAIIAGADYAADAGRLLSALASSGDAERAAPLIYGLALMELFALSNLK